MLLQCSHIPLQCPQSNPVELTTSHKRAGVRDLRRWGLTSAAAAVIVRLPRAVTRRRIQRKVVEISAIDDLAIRKMEQWRSTPPVEELGELASRVVAAAEELEAGLVERSLEARILLLAAFCGEHLLLLGPPGTAKSLLARRLVRFLGKEAVFFERLLTRFSVPEELFGPLSLKGLEQDEYLRKTTGYLPEASIAFVDEIFKANSAILNSLLSIVNERVFDNGPERVAVPLRCLVAASNEAPESEELEALYDRLLFRLIVNPVSDGGVSALIAATAFSSDPQDSDGAIPLGLEDAERALKGAATVTVPAVVVDIFKDCRSHLASLQPPELVSDRRLGQAVRMLQVVAWTCGRSQVEVCDCSLLAHVFWQSLENRETFQTWLQARLAKSRGRQLAAILSGLLDRVLSKATAAADLLGELQVFQRATEKEIVEAERQQQLARAHCWLPHKETQNFCAAVDLELDSRSGPRTLLMEVARLSAAAELAAEEVDVYVRKRRAVGDLEWSGSSSDASTIDEQTFKLGKHKGRLFSEVAENDVDYCNMVEKKVAAGSFGGDSPLDRQVRAFVSYLKESRSQ